MVPNRTTTAGITLFVSLSAATDQWLAAVCIGIACANWLSFGPGLAVVILNVSDSTTATHIGSRVSSSSSALYFVRVSLSGVGVVIQVTCYLLVNHEDMNHVMILVATAVSFVLNKIALEDTKTAALDVEETRMAQETHNISTV